MSNSRRNLVRRPSALMGLVLLGLCAAWSSGCSRAFYRQQADREIYCLENAASHRVGGLPEGYSIQTNPQSRMFDPNSPDCPPMPPDDPTSHALMQCVDCKKGWPGWKCYGNTPYVESPCWQSYLPRNEKDEVVLDRQAAVELALLNSREYQQQLENLYLSALDVSYQRFRFDAQFFGGNTTFFEHQGSDWGNGASSSILGTDTGLEMRKLYATGGELVVGMANSLVWQFAGPNDYSGTTLLDFSLVQPLLRAGGRAVVLESLTDSERALLANIRQMERFRRGFYAQIFAGRDPGSGPSPSGITLNNLSPGGGAGVGGFLSLLSQQVLIRNQEANVVSLRDSLSQLEALFKADKIDSYFQVDQARLQLYQAQIRLLNLKTQYQDTLDRYKVTLGLPPSLEVVISDPLLNRFDLIDPDLTAAQNTVTMLLNNVRDPEPGSALVDDVAHLEAVGRECAIQIEEVRKDLQLLDEALPERRLEIEHLASQPEFKQGDVDPSIVDVKLLDQRVAEMRQGFAEVSAQIESSLARLEPYKKLTTDNFRQFGASEDEARKQIEDIVELFSGQMIELSLLQARARLDTITLKPLTLSPVKALEIARENRRDWKNARAALVDVWRQVEVVANELESDLDLTFSGDLSTVNENPFQFRGTNSRLRVGLEFDAPLTRLLERNNYRTALINYQRARRQYYAYEDQVDQALRRTLREVQLAQINFEQRRAAVTVAASQVWLKQYDLLHKPQVGGGSYGATTARDVVDALNNLLSEQNNFLGVWVDYEVARLNLAFDLGTMELDEHGMWIDRGDYGPESTAEPALPETDPNALTPPLPLTLREVPAPEAEQIPLPPPVK